MPLPSEIVDAIVFDRSGDVQIDAQRRYVDLSVGQYTTGAPQNAAVATAALTALQTGKNVEDSIYAEVLPDPTPACDEPVVIKGRGSRFSSTDLETVLRGRRTETLFDAGVNTNNYVLATVSDAFNQDFPCVALADTCGSMNATDYQRSALLEIEAAQGFLITVEESRVLVERKCAAAVRL